MEDKYGFLKNMVFEYKYGLWKEPEVKNLWKGTEVII